MTTEDKMLRIDRTGEISHLPCTESGETCEFEEPLNVCHNLPARKSSKAARSFSKREIDKTRCASQTILKTTDHDTTQTEVDSHSFSSSSLSESGQSHSAAVCKLEDPEDASNHEEPSSQAADNTRSRISFSKIQIREFPIIVGDNPSVLTGTPITIDWEPVEEMTFDFEDYEDTRPETPRSMLELRMPAKHREAILKNQGFSLAERNKGKRMANVVKNRRKRTGETEALANISETMEGWKRATKNATWGRNQKKKERELLNSYRTA